MGLGMSRFPDPYQTRDDLSHATVFLVVLLLLIAVGAVLFFGNSWAFAPSDLMARLRASPTAGPSNDSSNPGGGPAFTAPTSVPPLAGVPYQPTPDHSVTPTVVNHPTATPASPNATPGSNQSAAPAPTASGPPTPTPAPPTPPPTARVANTGGDGVYLRHSPRLGDLWIAWPDNTPLTPQGAEADADGTHWLQVRDPKGNVGWVPAQYVTR